MLNTHDGLGTLNTIQYDKNVYKRIEFLHENYQQQAYSIQRYNGLCELTKLFFTVFTTTVHNYI